MKKPPLHFYSTKERLLPREMACNSSHNISHVTKIVQNNTEHVCEELVSELVYFLFTIVWLEYSWLQEMLSVVWWEKQLEMCLQMNECILVQVPDQSFNILIEAIKNKFNKAL